ncbi:LysR family transcriptional regulator (chromosome initiation inhibitor) [Acinetobacter calcoaceticus]|uniref:LysR family transcriptional regulator (Chromosome initiation inhibitor) n=1 Tax=Acinetobacter calcoaceticus TaxID=471 RepID=A0A4R1XVW8_ACICA|nr:LysR family transcriptional regulator (chromosome initiation inhibitor) [Acinetobacter calcoaceticus]
MLQSKQSDAFLAVIETGSFEAASAQLHLTAAAVSLRVQSLEKALGQILIVRERPCRPTLVGQQLLEHLQHIRLIQEGFLQNIQERTADSACYKIRVGSNADSLSTWLLGALQEILIKANIVLELNIDDQTQTYHLLETGLVNACISTEPQAMKACVAEPLGLMRYKLVASADFCQRWFAQGLNHQSLQLAPAVIFNEKDHLHTELLLKHFGLNSQRYPHHYIPSSTAFLHSIELGLGYGLLPLIQMQEQLANGSLIELAVDHPVDVALYWHHWKRQSLPLQQLTQHLLQQARRYLSPFPEPKPQ